VVSRFFPFFHFLRCQEAQKRSKGLVSRNQKMGSGSFSGPFLNSIGVLAIAFPFLQHTFLGTRILESLLLRLGASFCPLCAFLWKRLFGLITPEACSSPPPRPRPSSLSELEHVFNGPLPSSLTLFFFTVFRAAPLFWLLHQPLRIPCRRTRFPPGVLRLHRRIFS